MVKKSTVYTFGKSQVAAFVGGIFDYWVMIACTEFLHYHYTQSIVIGGMLGALLNFSINRYWTYNARQFSFKSQLLKFYIVVIGSIALKTGGTYFFSESLHIKYYYVRLFVDLIVSLGFNYTLQKYWVFKAEENEYQKA
ncbi:MAG TPA: GtrA family protein, partial [Chitinophagales bacterium]|nr:GtrA family protein [Chitinophagales bacterium]